MAESNANGGRVTMRDLMQMQEKTFDKLEAINKEMSNIKVKVALISGSVSVIITIVLHLVKAGING
ncbi:MAG: hypothetical protein ACE5IR_16205 [bacterium]